LGVKPVACHWIGIPAETENCEPLTIVMVGGAGVGVTGVGVVGMAIGSLPLNKMRRTIMIAMTATMTNAVPTSIYSKG